MATDKVSSAAQTLSLLVELTAVHALDLAQFLKRVGFSDFRTVAALVPPSGNDDEAYRMRDAAAVIHEALAVAGYAPR